jgi:hypothetical protein
MSQNSAVLDSVDALLSAAKPEVAHTNQPGSIAYPGTIVEQPILRDWDRKLYTSPHSKFHNGKRCRKLRELTKTDPEYAQLWNVEVAQSVVELEDGATAVVFLDEVKG